MEGILLDTMFDLPSLEGVEEVVISKEVVEGTARPLYIYADRADRTSDAPPAPEARHGASSSRRRFVDPACAGAVRDVRYLLEFPGLLDTPASRRHLM